MRDNTQLVRFDLPDHVSPVDETFAGHRVAVTYDSNFGGTVTAEGEATLDEGRYPSDWTTLVVDGRKVRSNGHVFSAESDRHLGTVESITAEAPHDEAVDLVASGMDHDVDRGEDETIVQGWDKGVMEQEGFMAGTMSVRLTHVEAEAEEPGVRA